MQWRHAGRPISAADLIQYLPPDQAAHVYIDASVLRSSGLLDLLAGSKATEEPDYRRFVEQTGFDYRTDLNAIAAAFLHGNTYLALRGRFQWNRLNEYARSQGGNCRNAVCTMPGASPDRHISFYPIRSDTLALAISTEERGSDMIGPTRWRNPPRLPGEPVWISVPSYMFGDVASMPSGTSSFLRPLAQAQEITFAVGPKDQQLQIRLEVMSATPEAAAALATQLSSTTELLKKMLARDHLTPNPRDLSGVLVAGRFQQQDRLVTGTWPVERGFVEALAAGQIK